MPQVLVVDDEPLLRRQVSEILGHYGFGAILEADDGLRALEIVRHQEVMLVIMDLVMPGLDGITVAEKISTIRKIPVILLTATADATTIERARLAGIMNFIIKPVQAEQLLVAVDLAIHQFVELASLREEVEKLRGTLETRKLVDRAKGILMKRGMDEASAFRRLQKLAMDKRKSLREVAEAILLAEE